MALSSAKNIADSFARVDEAGRLDAGPDSKPFDRRIGRGKHRRRAQHTDVDLVAKLKEAPGFGVLSDDDIVSLLAQTETRNFALGDIILRQGDPGSGFFVLRQGRVRVIDETDPASPVNLVVLPAGATFGERSLLFDTSVGATIRAAGRVTVQTLPIAAFRALVTKRPEIAQTMTDTIRRHDSFNFIRGVPILATLAGAEIERLLDLSEDVELEAGAVLARQGDPTESLCIVRSGRLEANAVVAVDAAGQPESNEAAVVPPAERLVGILRATDVCGLEAVENLAARSATVVAREQTRLFRWPINLIRDVLSANPAARNVIATAARLQREQYDTILNDAAIPATMLSMSPLRARTIRSGPFWWPGNTLVYCAEDTRLDGLACLHTANAYFGRPLANATQLDGGMPARQQESLTSLSRKAEDEGLITRLLRVRADRLAPAMIPFVFNGPDQRLKLAISLDDVKLAYADTASGELKIVKRSDLTGWWNGQALSLNYVPDFGAVGHRQADLLAQFLPILKPHARTLVRLLVLTLLGLLIGVAMPLFTQVIIDKVLVFNDRSLLLLMLLAILFASGMTLLSNGARSLLTIRVANQVNGILTTRLLGHMLAVPMGLIGKWRVGELSVRFEENHKILHLASHVVQVMLLDVVSALVFGAVLCTLAPGLTAISFAFVALAAMVMLRASPHLRRADQAVFEARRNLQSHLIEVFDGIETIKFVSQEDDFTDRGQTLLRRSTMASFKVGRLSFRVNLAVIALTIFATLAVLGFGGNEVLTGKMTAGELVAFVGLLGGVLDPLKRLAGTYDNIQELRIAIGRVNDILLMPREAGKGLAICPPIDGHLRFEKVNFSYDPASGRTILSNIDLEIQPGQKVALVGPSGSGKSTLVKLINRLIEPTAGRVLIDGIDVAQVEPNSLRRQIGLVEQFPHIFAGTIRDNITKAAPDLPFERVATVARLAGVSEFADRLPMRLNTRIGEGGRALSGGQTQRLIIARALANDPKMLILDEATSALDNESEQSVQRSMDAAMTGRTVVAIAHRLSTIRNADLILVMRAGRIVERGTHDSLMADGGLYRQLVQSGESPNVRAQDTA